jgi:hypothetical protein
LRLIAKNKAVCGELSGCGETLVQAPQKRGCVARPLPNKERGNKFGFFVNRDEDVLIPDLGRIGRAHADALLLNVGLDFVNLQIPGLESAHFGVHQTGAALSGYDEQSHHRVAIESGEPFRGSGRAALQKAMQRTFCHFFAGTHSS